MNGLISITGVVFVFAFLIHPAANSHDLGVYDDIFTESNLSELTSFVSDILTWKQRSIFAHGKELAIDKTFWRSSSHQDVLFSKTNSWKSIQELVMSDRLDYDGRAHGDELWPVNVEGRVLLRGDPPRVEKTNNSTTLTLFVFICEKWEKNFYGEMLVFSNNGDYLKSVHVRSGRVVLVPGSVGYVVKPPSMNTEQGLLVISLGVISNVATVLVSSLPPEYNDITFTLSPRENSWKIAKHISKEYQTADKKKIVVFDNVFTQDELNRFLEKIENGFYHYNPPNYDSDDNVMWILGLDVSNLLQSDLWKLFKKTLTATTGSETYYPYDVSCNNIQTWYHPKVHRDCNDDENDYTLIVYLTPNWTESYYGETVFYNDDEMFAVVRPKFGRLVVFHGTIPHSARPPSPTYKGLFVICLIWKFV